MTSSAELRAATRRAIQNALIANESWKHQSPERSVEAALREIEVAIDAEIAAARPFNQDALDLAGEAARAVILNLRANGHGDISDHPDLASMIEQACFNALQRFAARPQWQPIETMPRDHDPGPDTYWGPEVALRVPPCKHFPHGPTRYVGHLEADMWLVRSEDDPALWGELHCAPTHWMPLPDAPEPQR